MNIFFLSLNASECASLYCNQHVIKILLEITQMLYTAWHMSGEEFHPPRAKSGRRGYLPAHKNHPMCMWVRYSKNTYTFAAKLGMALAVEYNNRFKKCHACTKHIMWLHSNIPTCFQGAKSPTAYYGKLGIPQCMPSEHYDPDPVVAYRSYYTTKRIRLQSTTVLIHDFLECVSKKEGPLLLKQKEVVQWLCGDLSFLTERNKESEDKWGREVMKDRRPDLKLDKQWTNKFGEHLCEEIYTLLRENIRKPTKQNGYNPDLETDSAIIEVKTGTYCTSGPAGEKILGTPFKYCEVPELYGKPLKIVCLGGAEKACREQYGNLPGSKSSSQKAKFLDFFRENSIEYVGFSDLLRELY